jgi:hypothetical protein
MEILTAIAVSAVVWVTTLAVLIFGLFKGHFPAEESNMLFYLFLQAAIPSLVFWIMTHN